MTFISKDVRALKLHDWCAAPLNSPVIWQWSLTIISLGITFPSRTIFYRLKSHPHKWQFVASLNSLYSSSVNLGFLNLSNLSFNSKSNLIPSVFNESI